MRARMPEPRTDRQHHNLIREMSGFARWKESFIYMLKTLLGQVKEFRLLSILTPVCMIGEVICEMIIPVLMGRIVARGTPEELAANPASLTGRYLAELMED